MDAKELIRHALEARKKAYAPYSNYLVGAALISGEGKLYTGCNIENDGIQSICAERAAFIKALCDGQRQFEAIAVAGKYINSNEYIKKAIKTKPLAEILGFKVKIAPGSYKNIKITTKEDLIIAEGLL